MELRVCPAGNPVSVTGCLRTLNLVINILESQGRKKAIAKFGDTCFDCPHFERTMEDAA